MTPDDVLKAMAGTILAALSAAVAWLARTVIGNREAMLLHGGAIASLEARMGNLEREALTAEDVREVVEAALRSSERRQEETTKRLDQLTERLGRLHDDVLVIKTRCNAKECQ